MSGIEIAHLALGFIAKMHHEFVLKPAMEDAHAKLMATRVCQVKEPLEKWVKSQQQHDAMSNHHLVLLGKINDCLQKIHDWLDIFHKQGQKGKVARGMRIMKNMMASTVGGQSDFDQLLVLTGQLERCVKELTEWEVLEISQGMQEVREGISRVCAMLSEKRTGEVTEEMITTIAKEYSLDPSSVRKEVDASNEQLWGMVDQRFHELLRIQQQNHREQMQLLQKILDAKQVPLNAVQPSRAARPEKAVEKAEEKAARSLPPAAFLKPAHAAPRPAAVAPSAVGVTASKEARSLQSAFHLEVEGLAARLSQLNVRCEEALRNDDSPQRGRPEVPAHLRDAKQTDTKKKGMLTKLRKGDRISKGEVKNIVIYCDPNNIFASPDGEPNEVFRANFLQAVNKSVADPELQFRAWQEALLHVIETCK